MTTSAAALAYTSAGSGDRGNEILTPRGTNTYTAGAFIIDGIARAAAASIADKTNAINTVNKYLGKKVYDTSNNRIMYAVGSVNTDAWFRADGLTSVVPA